jgi:hypothetical protein
MAESTTPTEEGKEPTAREVTPAPKAKTTTRKRRKSASRKSTAKADNLTEGQTAVLQLVTISPAPRTADELAAQYEGLHEANLWPALPVEQVKRHLSELLSKKVLVEGDEAPDGEPTIEVAGAEG